MSFMEVSTEYVIVPDLFFVDAPQSNVLVDATGHARITDFGLAIVTQDLASMWKESDERCRSPRWIAPEILRDSEEHRRNPRCASRTLDKPGKYSKQADIFSFAGVAIEVRSR